MLKNMRISLNFWNVWQVIGVGTGWNKRVTGKMETLNGYKSKDNEMHRDAEVTHADSSLKIFYCDEALSGVNTIVVKLGTVCVRSYFLNRWSDCQMKIDAAQKFICTPDIWWTLTICGATNLSNKMFMSIAQVNDRSLCYQRWFCNKSDLLLQIRAKISDSRDNCVCCWY